MTTEIKKENNNNDQKKNSKYCTWKFWNLFLNIIFIFLGVFFVVLGISEISSRKELLYAFENKKNKLSKKYLDANIYQLSKSTNQKNAFSTNKTLKDNLSNISEKIKKLEGLNLQLETLIIKGTTEKNSSRQLSKKFHEIINETTNSGNENETFFKYMLDNKLTTSPSSSILIALITIFSAIIGVIGAALRRYNSNYDKDKCKDKRKLDNVFVSLTTGTIVGLITYSFIHGGKALFVSTYLENIPTTNSNTTVFLALFSGLFSKQLFYLLNEIVNVYKKRIIEVISMKKKGKRKGKKKANSNQGNRNKNDNNSKNEESKKDNNLGN